MMMKTISRLLLTLIGVFVVSQSVSATEIPRKVSTITRIFFPMIDSAKGEPVTGAAGLDSEFSEAGHLTTPTTFSDCASEAVEIATNSGEYWLAVAAAELDSAFTIFKITSSTAGVLTQTIIVRTTTEDPVNTATTDDGGTINVTGGAVDLVTTTTTSTNLTTNNDKTGYALSGAGNTAVIDDFETQSQADPTGFHVNLLEWLGTAAATPTTAGVPEVDVTFWEGELVPEATDTGIPQVDVAFYETSTDVDGNIQSEAADALAAYDGPTDAEMIARTIVTANYFDPTTDEVVLQGDSLATFMTNLDDLQAFLGACDGCWYQLFPSDGTANKDSARVYDPALAADSLIGRIRWFHNAVDAVYDSARFDLY